MKSFCRLRLDGSARTARCHYHPWPLRLIACLLIILELLVPCNTQVLVAAELLFAQSSSSPGATKRSQGPAPVLTREDLPVNRTPPQVTPPPASPVFSDPPTDDEISRAAV